MDYLITKNDITYHCTSDILEHHGIKGQKWGVRRYQNPDGSLTEKGRVRYRKQEIKALSKQKRQDAKAYNKTRSLAARAMTAVLVGPFSNTLYSDFRITGNSKAVAMRKTALASFLTGSNGNYAIQLYRQAKRATDEVDRKIAESTASESHKKKAHFEMDSKHKQ